METTGNVYGKWAEILPEDGITRQHTTMGNMLRPLQSSSRIPAHSTCNYQENLSCDCEIASLHDLLINLYLLVDSHCCNLSICLKNIGAFILDIHTHILHMSLITITAFPCMACPHRSDPGWAGIRFREKINLTTFRTPKVMQIIHQRTLRSSLKIKDLRVHLVITVTIVSCCKY